MPMRNPFRRAAGVEDDVMQQTTDGAFRDTKVEGAKAIDVPKPAEYKLCDISDSGVYMPPSPSESKSSFWHSTSNASTNSSNHRSLLTDNEPFNISRESFDSYRRSFDISARSPIPSSDAYRHSIDSRRINITRPSFTRPSIDRPNAHMDQGFEDVGLAEEPKPAERKRGIFTFGHSDDSKAANVATEKKSYGLFTGRKRGQSGAGSELKAMERPSSRHLVETRAET